MIATMTTTSTPMPTAAVARCHPVSLFTILH